jgi:hypothetical protein
MKNTPHMEIPAFHAAGVLLISDSDSICTPAVPYSHLLFKLGVFFILYVGN